MRRRSGIALVAALALMTVLGLLIVGAVGSVVAAQRGAELAASSATLDAAADYAVATVLADARGYGLDELELGRARRYSISSINGRVATVSVTRLPGGVLWLVGTLADGAPDSSRRTVNLAARYPVVGPIPPSGVFARGGVEASDAVVFRVDTATDADCAAQAPSLISDVTTATGAAVSVGPGARATTSSAASDTVAYFLTAKQRAVLDSGGAVVHVRGDTTIAGGTLNGVLIADGAVTVTGAFSLSGLLIARDSIVSSGGLSVRGAMLAFSSAAVAIRVTGATIVYAPCQIARALRRVTRPAPVRGRAWAELF